MCKKLSTGLFIIPLLLSMVAVYISPAYGDFNIRVAGVGLEEIGSNKTIVIKVELEAHAPILSVMLSYFDIHGNLVNATMSLIECNVENSWWRATIQPRLYEEKNKAMTINYVDPMKLYVTQPQGTLQIELCLPSWGFQTGTMPMILPTHSLELLTASAFTVLGVTIMQQYFTRKRK